VELGAINLIPDGKVSDTGATADDQGFSHNEGDADEVAGRSGEKTMPPPHLQDI